VRYDLGEGMTLDIYEGGRAIDWATPRAFMEFLDERFGFEPTLDAAATARNAKASRFYGPMQDGLKHPWNGHVWLNPPYGRDLPSWLEKCASEIKNNDECRSIYCLIPARTDTQWFHDIIMPNAYLVYLIKGRINFKHHTAIKGKNAPFPSMLVVWRRHRLPECGITTLDVSASSRGNGE